MTRGAPAEGDVHVVRSLGFAAFRALDVLLRIIPESWAYAVSSFLALVLERIWGYRKSVVETNLRAAFPRRPPAEIRSLVHRFYVYLGDLIVEIMRIHGLPAARLARQVRFKNPELVAGLLGRRRSVIALAGHYGNWEFLSLLRTILDAPCLAPYLPPKNPLFDGYLTRARARFGGEIVHQDLFYRRLSRCVRRGTPAFSLVLADQAPEKGKIDLWLPFLGRPAACTTGWEKIARRIGSAVVFLEVVRERRGFYSYTFRLMTEGAGGEPPSGLTEEYHRRLEAEIASDPALWLWSHRRWKHAPPAETKL